MKRAGMVFIGACAVLVACGGGGSGESTETVATTTEVAVTTTQPATTTSPTSTTASTTTTSTTTTTTTTTSTTLAPTTTLSEEQAAIAAAEEALVAAFDARTEALTDPDNPELREQVAEWWAEAALPSVIGQLDEFVTGGKLLKMSTDPVSFVEVIGESSVLSSDRIDVTFCRLDSNLIVLAEPLGDLEVVVDDTITTRIWSGAMISEDDGWRLAGADILAEVDGEVPCDELQ